MLGFDVLLPVGVTGVVEEKGNESLFEVHLRIYKQQLKLCGLMSFLS